MSRAQVADGYADVSIRLPIRQIIQLMRKEKSFLFSQVSSSTQHHTIERIRSRLQLS